MYFDQTRTVAVEFTEGGHTEPEAWRDAALTNVDLLLTAEEFQRVAQELEAVLQRYRGRARSPGSRLVRVMNVVVPHHRASSEAGSPRA